MISPELLRRFPFFGFLDDTQLKAVAMLAEEVEVEQGTNIFESEQPATALYVMVDGSIDLHYKVIDRDDPHIVKEFFISELNPGDIFGLSAIVEPFVHTMTSKVLAAGKVIKIEGLGRRFSGLYYVTATSHTYTPAAGYRTAITVKRNAS